MGKNRTVQLTRGENSRDCLTQLRDSAVRARDNLRKLVNKENPMEILYQIKFKSIGCDPLVDEPLNLIEQVNQIFTCYATFKAATRLFEWHKDLHRLTLKLCEERGIDITSEDCGGIAAEVFAATHPDNNKKQRKEEAKVMKTNAKHKYVFFMCRGYGEERIKKSQDLIVYSLGGEMDDF